MEFKARTIRFDIVQPLDEDVTLTLEEEREVIRALLTECPPTKSVQLISHQNAINAALRAAKPGMPFDALAGFRL